MNALKRFFPYFRLLAPHKWAFLGALACGAIYGVATGYGMPKMVKQILPAIFESQSEQYVIGAVLLIPAVMFVRSASQFGNSYLSSYCGVKVLEGIRSQLFGKLQDLHLGFFAKRNKGDLLSRLLVDCNSVRAAVMDVSNILIKEPFTIVWAVGFLVQLAVEKKQIIFLLSFLIAIPACVFPIRHFGRKLARKTARMQEQAGSLTEVASENLGALREVRAYGLENAQKSKFTEAIRRFIGLQLKVVKYDKMVTPSIELITGVILAAAIYQMAHSKLDIKVGEMTSLFTAIFLAYDPIKKLGEVNNHIRKGLASLDRIEEVLNEPVAIQDPAEPRALPTPVSGRIEFRGVSFSYGEDPVLRGIDCLLEPGKTYALVGPSGAGKSTFINLVLRFYDPTEGGVFLDEIDLRELRQSDLRGHIALVPQDPVLFNDTILSNILLSRPAAGRAEVEAAASRAHAHEFIAATEQGYDTIVGDRGARLSGGQKQRIALSRAFLRDSPILILDEATSALDSESESIIHDALEKLIQGKTVLMIAHRFSTLKMANEILVFKEGQIIGRGTHAELIESNEVYKNLYLKQELP